MTDDIDSFLAQLDTVIDGPKAVRVTTNLTKSASSASTPVIGSSNTSRSKTIAATNALLLTAATTSATGEKIEDAEMDALLHNLSKVVTSPPPLPKRVEVAAAPAASSRCYPVYVTGTGSDKDRCCKSLRCTNCNMAVIRVPDHEWNSKVDYMFFRLHFPDLSKLRPNLMRRPGSAAFACQCTWRSAHSTGAGGTVGALNITSDSTARWFCAGHP